MNILEVNLPDRISHPFDDTPACIPVAIPGLEDVVQFGIDKHRVGENWQGRAFGWPAEYRQQGNLPAGFYIGVNNIYFVALDWELGPDEEPFIHIEDDYGYGFDEREQIQRIKRMKELAH